MSRARALRRLTTTELELMAACVGAHADLDREALVRLYQTDAATRWHWMGRPDGWPGNDTLCALWNDNRPSPEQVIARAIAAAQAADQRYAMGTSGPRWLADTFDPEGDGADCSDLVSWCLGRRKAGGPDWINSRGQRNWLHTGSIVHDAAHSQVLFARIAEPVGPCVVSYPDRNGKQGHTAIIITAADGHLRGVDCSYSQGRRTGDAVKVRDLSWFTRRASVVFCRPVWWPEVEL